MRALLAALADLWLTLALGLTLSCGPNELPNPDGGPALGTCDARWEWCTITEPDGGTRVVGAP